MANVAKAMAMIAEFRRKPKQGVYRNITSEQVAQGLEARVRCPGLIRQSTTSLCGPASLMYCLATDKPYNYVNYVLSLYQTGNAQLGGLTVKPGADCRKVVIPASTKDIWQIHPVDWIALASLRDSENDWFDYDDVDDRAAGITMPSDLCTWFRKAGYKSTCDRTYLHNKRSRSSLLNVDLFRRSHKVILLINAQVLRKATQKLPSNGPNHWVVLTSPVVIDRNDHICLKVFTWGQNSWAIPQARTMPVSDFLKQYYGFLTAA